MAVQDRCTQAMATPGVALRLAAATGHARWHVGGACPRRRPSKSAVLVIDANTGRVLHQSAADEPRHPASLAKMMTHLPGLRAHRAGPAQLPDQDQVLRQRRGGRPLQARSRGGRGDRAHRCHQGAHHQERQRRGRGDCRAHRRQRGEVRQAHDAARRASSACPPRPSAMPRACPTTQQVTTARDMVTLALQAAGRLPQALSAVCHAHRSPTRTRPSATTTRCSSTTRAPTG